MKQKTTLQNKIVYLSLIMLLTLASTAIIHTIYAQSNQIDIGWNMNVTLQANNGAPTIIGPSATFAPFDLIQLTANISNQNLTTSNILVSFDVEGPLNSSYPTQIVRSATTDQTGSANCTFRIPLDANERPVLGTWQVFINAKTSEGIVQQNSTFQVAWPFEITSIGFTNSKGQNQTIFNQGDAATAVLTLNSNRANTENITLNAKDAAGNEIEQTQLQNILINQTSNNKVEYTFKIPNTATAGPATIASMVSSGSYQNIDIPASENKTGYFTITKGSLTPKPSFENSLSLFSWLLIATGLFTFTILFVFLRRKRTSGKAQTPVFAPSTPSPATGTPAVGPSVTLQETSQQPDLQIKSPTPKIASTKVMEATIMTETNMNEQTETLSKPMTIMEVGKPDLETSTANEPTAQATLAHLSRISIAAKRVQAIRTAMKSKKEQLTQDITELDKLVDEQEKALKTYFGTVREEMEKAKTNLTDLEGALEAKAIPNWAPDKARELTLQAILAYRSRIASTEKIIQALSTALKLENEQLALDLMEFNQQINDDEKKLKNYFDILRQEIKWLQNYLNDEKT